MALAAPFETFAVKTPQTYDTACGTSISAPYVAGVAALVWSHWGFSNQGLREHLLVTALDRPPAGEDDSTGYGVVQANLANVFSPPFITATIYSNRPRLTWPAVPAAGSYRIYRKVPPYTWEWEQYASTTATSYTDWATQVTSFYGYSSQPGGGATWVSYYVVAVSTSGLESQLYTRYATYIPNGIPPY